MEAPYQQLQRFPHFNLALLRATGQHARLGPKMDMDAIGIAQKSFEMVTEIVKMMKNEAVLEHNNPSIRMAATALIMEVTVTRGQNASYGIGLETTANGVYVMAVDPDSSSKLNAYCGMQGFSGCDRGRGRGRRRLAAGQARDLGARDCGRSSSTSCMALDQHM